MRFGYRVKKYDGKKSMRGVRFFIKMFVFAAVLVGVTAFTIHNYSWIFAKNIQGEIIEIERINTPDAIIGNTTSTQMHSYAILIQDQTGMMYTASSEDRQWQVAKKGYCALATLYRYPPWDLEKGGTFFNARLKQVYKCPGKTEEPSATEAPSEEEI